MLVVDTESNGLLDEATKLHVINLIDTTSGEREAYHDDPALARRGSLSDGVLRLKAATERCDILAGHNLIRHDLPLIRKLYPDFGWNTDYIFDTLVCSRLIWTDLGDIDQRALLKGKRPSGFREKRLMGSHSLAAWGYRLGSLKGDFKGPWDTFTPAMQEYAIQDVEVTLKLVELIQQQEYSEEAIRLEHRVAEIIFEQERHGFWFDRDAAEKLEVELTKETAELEDRLRVAFDPWFEPVRAKGQIVATTPKRSMRRKAEIDGTMLVSETTTDAPYVKVRLQLFEPGSRDKIANRLTSRYGWTPVDFTETGKPKVDETTLGGLDYPETKLLVRYLTVAKRLGQLATGKEAWLKRVGPDNRIHGRVNTNGAVTGRMTHSNPNVAQVPRVGSLYGAECRRLFAAPPGKALVGVDAESLELRMLAHYMARYDGGTYAKTVVGGTKEAGTDKHTVNQRAVGFNTRDGAKTLIYAYLYGAGALKLGKITYDDLTEKQRAGFNAKHAPGRAREEAMARLGTRTRKRLEASIPALGSLQEAVKAATRNGKTLRGLDGRRLNVRSQHTALNTLLQSAGAVIMKKALVLAAEDFHERELEVAFVANIHDEIQMEVSPDIQNTVGRIAADAIRRAGEAFNLRCPLSGSAAAGDTWAATH